MSFALAYKSRSKLTDNKPSPAASNLDSSDHIMNEINKNNSNIRSANGSPLDSSTEEFMESRFGHNFSSVKIHTDKQAAMSANSINARAYTIGNNIVFGTDEYKTQTAEGKHLIAHELTHIVQQQSQLAGSRLHPLVQRQSKGKTLAEQKIATTDPATRQSAAIIDAVLLRSKRLAPYIGARLKSGFSIAEKGRFVMHLSNGNFEDAYRKTYNFSSGESVPKHITGFFDPGKSVVHLRPNATFGVALHEAMHRTAALLMNTGISRAAKAISEDLMKTLLEGTTAYMVDQVLDEEGLPKFIDAYSREKKKIAGLVTALGSKGFDLVARMYFNAELLSIGIALGVSEKQYIEDMKQKKSYDQVLRKINAKL